VHVGECEMRGETVSGLAVHTAARVMATAGDGEVYVSDALREAVVEFDVVLADRGLHELKGVPGEWRLYRVDALTAR
jgi:class 3 adenylate cyclase